MKTSADLAELDCMFQELTVALSEQDFERFSQALAVQKAWVAAHLELFDETAKKRVCEGMQQLLVLARSSRAHCLDAILINRRKLAVLAAYQGCGTT